MTKAKQPCKGVRRGQCYYTEDEFVKHNRASLMRKPPTDEERRRQYRAIVADGDIPPTCPLCGWAHLPKDTD